MRSTHFTAIVIALLIGGWLLSGWLGSGPPPAHPTLAEANQQRVVRAQDETPAQVRARVIEASPQTEEVVLRGRTENKRTLVVKAETSGRVVERPVERGTRVEVGQLLCRLADDDRSAALEEAAQALNQARIDYAGSVKLRERALLSESSVAQARARVAAAEAQVKRRQLDIERTAVRAPFAAIVEDAHLEIGDYVSPGTPCVSLVDMNPMLLVARVAERDVQSIEVGKQATGVLSDGREIAGVVTFVGQQSDPATRTYPVEVQVPNADLALRSGITARIRIPTATVMAQKVSPAIFALDDAGNIGVRTLDEHNRVEYHRVRILHDDGDGVWVTGLPEVAVVITVGQELVTPGQIVRANYESEPELPVATPDGGTAPTGREAVRAAAPQDGAVVSAGSAPTPALAAARP